MVELDVVLVLLKLPLPLVLEPLAGQQLSVDDTGILPIQRTVPFPLHGLVDVLYAPVVLFWYVFPQVVLF